MIGSVCNEYFYIKMLFSQRDMEREPQGDQCDTGSSGKENITMESAIIFITRKPALADSLRSYKIFLNEKLVGTIRQGMSSSFEVYPGHHDIFLTIDWCASRRVSIDLEPGDEVNLFCQPSNPWFAFYNITFGANNYIKLFQEPFKDPLKY